jgi:hypothetical protein
VTHTVIKFLVMLGKLYPTFKYLIERI